LFNLYANLLLLLLLNDGICVRKGSVENI